MCAEKAYESLMTRKMYNQSGREANVNINSHRVTTFPDKNVYQYDVSRTFIMPGDIKFRLKGRTDIPHQK